MTKTNHSTIMSEQLICEYVNTDLEKPVVVFFAGIHGNEPSGVNALKTLNNEWKSSELNGSSYAIYGNKWALKEGVRFHAEDLNRMWTSDRIAELAGDQWKPTNNDEKEQRAIWDLVKTILDRHNGPIYFIDLHTTSGETKPFVVMNDSLLNRAFTMHFPLPVILGVEEYLSGPLLVISMSWAM